MGQNNLHIRLYIRMRVIREFTIKYIKLYPNEFCGSFVWFENWYYFSAKLVNTDILSCSANSGT
jgi:hypothetical protein